MPLYRPDVWLHLSTPTGAREPAVALDALEAHVARELDPSDDDVPGLEASRPCYRRPEEVPDDAPVVSLRVCIRADVRAPTADLALQRLTSWAKPRCGRREGAGDPIQVDAAGAGCLAEELPAKLAGRFGELPT